MGCLDKLNIFKWNYRHIKLLQFPFFVKSSVYEIILIACSFRTTRSSTILVFIFLNKIKYLEEMVRLFYCLHLLITEI